MCLPLGIKNAAQLSPSGFVDEDTEVTVTCLEGHGLNGTGVITCQSDGSWSTAPRCGKFIHNAGSNIKAERGQETF